jgi:hypothetical protein
LPRLDGQIAKAFFVTFPGANEHIPDSQNPAGAS